MIQTKQKNEKKHNYFYKITNLINQKYYYGIHSTDNLEDGYMGSGKTLLKAIKKHGYENFNKEIIADYPARKEASDHEKRVVTMDLVLDENCYNLRTGGDNEFIQPMTEETRENFRKAQLGRKHTAETKQKMSVWQIGKTVSELTIEKIKITKEQRKSEYTTTQQRLEKNNGVWVTEETKQKIKENYSHQRKCNINGIDFDYMKLVCKFYNITMATLRRRIKSDHDNWKNWKYV